MKTLFYRLAFAFASAFLAFLDVWLFIVTLLQQNSGEDGFLAFCFLLSALYHGFIILIIVRSFRKGTYFLPEIMFDEDGHPSRIAALAALTLAFVGLFGLIYYALALGGVNPYTGMDDKVVFELIVSTASLLFENALFALLYVALFKNEPRDLR